jgi:hypothetical protein
MRLDPYMLSCLNFHLSFSYSPLYFSELNIRGYTAYLLPHSQHATMLFDCLVGILDREPRVCLVKGLGLA